MQAHSAVRVTRNCCGYLALASVHMGSVLDYSLGRYCSVGDNRRDRILQALSTHATETKMNF